MFGRGGCSSKTCLADTQRRNHEDGCRLGVGNREGLEGRDTTALFGGGNVKVRVCAYLSGSG